MDEKAAVAADALAHFLATDDCADQKALYQEVCELLDAVPEMAFKKFVHYALEPGYYSSAAEKRARIKVTLLTLLEKCSDTLSGSVATAQRLKQIIVDWLATGEETGDCVVVTVSKRGSVYIKHDNFYRRHIVPHQWIYRLFKGYVPEKESKKILLTKSCKQKDKPGTSCLNPSHVYYNRRCSWTEVVWILGGDDGESWRDFDGFY